MKYILESPCTYQGGKQRLRSAILDLIEEREGKDFLLYDICCGSGAVSLEAIQRGHSVVMVDSGCYGAVWESIVNNKFSIEVFEREIEKLPGVGGIHDYLQELSNKPVDVSLYPYHYLLLQAGAFGGKQIWIEGDKWCNNTFRNYWLPTETSSRRSPVNPMMPMPETLKERVKKLDRVLPKDRIKVYNEDVLKLLNKIQKGENIVVYIDPPYQNTQGYRDNFDLYTLLDDLKRKGIPTYVSEGVELKGAVVTYKMSESRKKGNISGTIKKKSVEEWVNLFL